MLEALAPSAPRAPRPVAKRSPPTRAAVARPTAYDAAMRTTVWALTLLALICGSRSGAPSSGATTPRASAIVDYEVHEWGLIRRAAFDPPPRVVHRAIAVWSPLRPSGASH